MSKHISKRIDKKRQRTRKSTVYKAMTRKAEVDDLRHRKNTELAVEVCTRLWPALQREIARQIKEAFDAGVPAVIDTGKEDAPSCIVRP